jgi:DNA-binding transcriptional LysR family regulator
MEHRNRDLNDMAVFAEIAAAGGISAAAGRIGLPKSNVSRRLARLEARLGVQLIERTTRASRLTPVGRSYADHCRQMIDNANGADDVVESSLATPSGELRVTASVLVGQGVITPALSEYAQQFPSVVVSLSLTNRRVNVVEDGFDLAFRIGRSEDSTLISQTVGAFPMRLYASVAYVEKNGTPDQPEDLRFHNCLSMSEFENVRQWHLSCDGEEHLTDLSPRIIVNDFISLRTLVEDGLGISLFPDYVVQEGVGAGRLMPVLQDWCGPMSELSAIYASRRGATPKVRAFIASVRRAVASTNSR